LLIFRKHFSQERFLEKSFEKVMEISSKSFEKMMHKQGPTVCSNLFTGVFGKQEGMVLIITSRTKPEILGHVVHCF